MSEVVICAGTNRKFGTDATTFRERPIASSARPIRVRALIRRTESADLGDDVEVVRGDLADDKFHRRPISMSSRGQRLPWAEVDDRQITVHLVKNLPNGTIN